MRSNYTSKLIDSTTMVTMNRWNARNPQTTSYKSTHIKITHTHMHMHTHIYPPPTHTHIPTHTPTHPHTHTHLRTLCPANSNRRQKVSPMMVERRWPTCISLAMLGEEKSTMTLSFLSTGGGRTPCTRSSWTSWETYEGARETLMKPAPATSSWKKKTTMCHCSRV